LNGKVKALKGPNPQSGAAEIECSFHYGNGYTDVFNAVGVKTRYIYDSRFQLVAIERYDDQENQYRIEQKYWGKTKSDAGLLLAKTIADGSGNIRSYRSFQYDKWGNVLEETLPGVGLPEVIEEKAWDLKTKQQILIKKLVNTYDDQSNLLSCITYDANGQYAFTERRTYNVLGQVISQTDAAGRETVYNYDAVGNQTFIQNENRLTTISYDLQNQPIETTEITAAGQCTTVNSYDILGRKICSTDRFGNSTFFEYDAFDRLAKVTYPEVIEENNQLIRPRFTYSYDIFGNVVTIQDPMGFITSKSYNLRGDPTKM